MSIHVPEHRSIISGVLVSRNYQEGRMSVRNRDETLVHIPVSGRCNNNCIFCLDGDKKYFKDIVSIKDVARQLKTAKKQGYSAVSFESGETTLNRHLPDFIVLAKREGFTEIGMSSNGRRFSYLPYLSLLIKKGATHFSVAIHGSKPSVHNALTRTPDSFNQTLQGIKNLCMLSKKSHFHFSVKVVLTNINLDDFPDLVDMLLDLGVKRMSVNVAIPKGGAEKFFDRIIPEYSLVAAVVGKKMTTMSKADREKVSFVGLPFCLMRSLVGNVDTKDVVFMSDMPQRRVFTSDCVRVKRKECKPCVYHMSCPGVPREYIVKRGWNEFKPCRHEIGE